MQVNISATTGFCVCLGGVRPFEGRPWELLEQHYIAQPPPLRKWRSDLPVAIEQVVLRALAKNPQERYVSMCAFAQALERAYRESRHSGHDSQITAVSPIVRGSLAVVTKGGKFKQERIFLSASPNDGLVAARLAADLKRRGLLLSNDLPGRVTDQEDTIQEAMRVADHVVIAVTPQTRSSCVVKEHLRLAQMYQRQPVLVWAEGNEIGAMLLDQTWAQLPPVDVIDARGDRYGVALEELLAYLREDTNLSSNEQTTSFVAPEFLLNNYVLNK